MAKKPEAEDPDIPPPRATSVFTDMRRRSSSFSLPIAAGGCRMRGCSAVNSE